MVQEATAHDRNSYVQSRPLSLAAFLEITDQCSNCGAAQKKTLPGMWLPGMWHRLVSQ